MSRLKRAGLIAIFVLFTLAGVALIVFGDGSDRLLGVVALLVFGGGGATWFFVSQPRRRLSGLQVGSVARMGSRQAAFVARADRRVVIVAGLGAMAMGIGTLLVLVLPDEGGGLNKVERILLAAGGLLFVGIAMVGLWRAANRSDLALTRDGLMSTGPGGWFIRWDAIVSTGEMEVYDNPFLAINVTDPSAIEMGRFQRLVHWSQRSMMGLDLSFPLRMLAVDPAELHAAIGRYLEHPELRGRIGRADELAAVRSSATSGEAAAPAAGEPQRPSIRRIAGIGALFVVGSLLGLFSFVGAIDEVPPDRERARFLGVALFGVLALGQVAAGFLLLRRRQLGRWLGLAASFATLCLAILVLIRSEPDGRTVGVVLLAILVVHVLIVAVGARTADPRRASP